MMDQVTVTCTGLGLSGWGDAQETGRRGTQVRSQAGKMGGWETDGCAWEWQVRES